jgi:hypothetical protein
MPTIRVPLEGLSARLERDFARLRPFMHDALFLTVATRGVALATMGVATAQPRQPVDRGEYRRSFAAAKVPDGAVLYNSAAYAGVIEYGRRPGQKRPPTKALTAWVLRKGLTRNAQAAKGIAFAIARKIGRDGWPSPPNQPMRILEKAVDQLMPHIRAAMKVAIARALGGAE